MSPRAERPSGSKTKVKRDTTAITPHFQWKRNKSGTFCSQHKRGGQLIGSKKELEEKSHQVTSSDLRKKDDRTLEMREV